MLLFGLNMKPTLICRPDSGVTRQISLLIRISNATVLNSRHFWQQNKKAAETWQQIVTAKEEGGRFFAAEGGRTLAAEGGRTLAADFPKVEFWRQNFQEVELLRQIFRKVEFWRQIFQKVKFWRQIFQAAEWVSWEHISCLLVCGRIFAAENARRQKIRAAEIPAADFFF